MQRRESLALARGAAQQPARDGHAVERAGEGADAVGVPHPRLDPVGLETGGRGGLPSGTAYGVAVGPQGARQTATAAPAADDQDPRQG